MERVVQNAATLTPHPLRTRTLPRALTNTLLLEAFCLVRSRAHTGTMSRAHVHGGQQRRTRDLYGGSSNKENHVSRSQNASQSKQLREPDDDQGMVNETTEESGCTCKIDIIKQVP